MKKSILNLGKALNKTQQADIFGGVLDLINLIPQCKDVCPSATRQKSCGPPHCLGVCDGHGGFYLY